MWLAWHIAAFGRTKKMPNLTKIMKEYDEPRPVARHTPDVLREKAKMITVALGGTVNG